MSNDTGITDEFWIRFIRRYNVILSRYLRLRTILRDFLDEEDRFVPTPAAVTVTEGVATFQQVTATTSASSATVTEGRRVATFHQDTATTSASTTTEKQVSGRSSSRRLSRSRSPVERNRLETVSQESVSAAIHQHPMVASDSLIVDEPTTAALSFGTPDIASLVRPSIFVGRRSNANSETVVKKEKGAANDASHSDGPSLESVWSEAPSVEF